MGASVNPKASCHKCGDPLRVNPFHQTQPYHLGLFRNYTYPSTVFFVSKIFAVLTQPLTWVMALLLASLWARNRPKLARKLVGMALALLLLLGWQPLPDLLIRQLENQYAEMPPQVDLKGYVGMVVLGGSTDPSYVAQAHIQTVLNDAAERMTAPIAMLRANPHLHMVYTGGGPDVPLGTLSEAQRAKIFFDSMGVSGPGVRYETASRTTHENATLSAQLPGVDVTQRWLLVTSAWHMPRSMATFTKAGWNVTAYPVDFRTGLATPWTEYSLVSGLRSWQLVLHELLGGLAYRLTGRV